MLDLQNPKYGFNKSKGGEQILRLGKKHTEETKQRMSIKRKGINMYGARPVICYYKGNQVCISGCIKEAGQRLDEYLGISPSKNGSPKTEVVIKKYLAGTLSKRSKYNALVVKELTKDEYLKLKNIA